MIRKSVRSSWIAFMVCLLTAPLVTSASDNCRKVNILVKAGLPPDTCAFDQCGTDYSRAGLGRGTWHTGLNQTDVAPVPIPDEYVFTGTFETNFEAQNGDLLNGHAAFVAAPARPGLTGIIYFMNGGTGRFADVSAFLTRSERDEESFRLSGEVCGLKPQKPGHDNWQQQDWED